MRCASAATCIRFIFAAKQRTAETDRVFREAVGSFRRLSVTEIDRVKPLRLRLVTVGAGDTVERLASRMAVSDRAAERFRVLNGLGPARAPSRATRSSSWSSELRKPATTTNVEFKPGNA